MPTLYVTEPGATLRKSADSLIITVDDRRTAADSRRRTLLEVEPHRLECIGLFGRVHITRDAMLLCLARGIDVSWFSATGLYRGRTVAALSRTADLRVAQYAASVDEPRRLEIGCILVVSKLNNAIAVLEAIRSNRCGQPDLAQAIRDLKQIRPRVAQCTHVDELMGVEGHFTRTYFRGYKQGFSGDISFHVRRRRPPPDPANALLSFGYVLIGNLIASLLEGRGFDPAIGFLHTRRSGRAALALDLLEEFRQSVVDRFVLRTCNLRIFKPDMFEPDLKREGGVRLVQSALKVFFGQWERFLQRPLSAVDDESVPVRETLRRQIDRLAGYVREGNRYRPFRFGR